MIDLFRVRRFFAFAFVLAIPAFFFGHGFTTDADPSNDDIGGALLAFALVAAVYVALYMLFGLFFLVREPRWQRLRDIPGDRLSPANPLTRALVSLFRLAGVVLSLPVVGFVAAVVFVATQGVGWAMGSWVEAPALWLRDLPAELVAQARRLWPELGYAYLATRPFFWMLREELRNNPPLTMRPPKREKPRRQTPEPAPKVKAAPPEAPTPQPPPAPQRPKPAEPAVHTVRDVLPGFAADVDAEVLRRQRTGG